MIQLISYSPWNESFNEGTLFYRCHKKDAQEISKLKCGDVFRVKSICDYKNEDDYEVYEYEYDGGEIERDERKEYQFSDEENNLQHPYQTSWGVSTRLIGMVIMAHGDDKGLNLPPKLAPHQVVVIPITPNEDSKATVLEATQKISEELGKSFRVYVDDRDNISPGFKFNEWELKGVPLRIEIGPRDVENKSVVFSRRDGVDGKFDINFDDINTKVTETLDDVHKNLLNLSRNFREENTVHVDSYDELISALNGEPGFVTCFWNENSEDENKVKAETKATLRCYVLNEEKTDKAVNNENEQGKLAIFSKAY